jgi:hypothetical protein
MFTGLGALSIGLLGKIQHDEDVGNDCCARRSNALQPDDGAIRGCACDSHGLAAASRPS